MPETYRADTEILFRLTDRCVQLAALLNAVRPSVGEEDGRRIHALLAAVRYRKGDQLFALMTDALQAEEDVSEIRKGASPSLPDTASWRIWQHPSWSIPEEQREDRPRRTLFRYPRRDQFRSFLCTKSATYTAKILKTVP